MFGGAACWAIAALAVLEWPSQWILIAGKLAVGRYDWFSFQSIRGFCGVVVAHQIRWPLFTHCGNKYNCAADCPLAEYTDGDRAGLALATKEFIVKLGQWIALLAIVAATYVLWQIKDILLNIFAAVVLANSLNVLALTLQRRLKWGRSLAVLTSVFCLVGFIIAFFILVVPPFAKQLQELYILVPQGIDQFNNWLDSLNRWAPASVREYVPDVNSILQQVLPVLNRVLGGSFAFFSSSFGTALNILLIVVLGLMFLIDPTTYRNGFIRLFPSFYRRRIDSILVECERALGQWIGGALISMGVIAVCSTTGLYFIGVPAALANGILAGLLNFIPNLGPTFSVLPPMTIALLDSPAKSLLVLGLYIGIQQFESNFLTPFVMAQQVNLMPAVTLLAQVFFATVFGFWGLLLALPLVVVCQIWIRCILVEDVMDRWRSPFPQLANASAPPEAGFEPVPFQPEPGTIAPDQNFQPIDASLPIANSSETDSANDSESPPA